MIFLIKTVLVVLIIIGVGVFLVYRVPALKEHVVEVINPNAKEGKILGELSTQLDNLDSAISGLGGSNNSMNEAKVKKSKELLAKSKDLLNDASELNDKGSGLTAIVGQQVGNIISSVINQTSQKVGQSLLSSSSPSPSCPQ